VILNSALFSNPLVNNYPILRLSALNVPTLTLLSANTGGNDRSKNVWASRAWFSPTPSLRFTLSLFPSPFRIPPSIYLSPSITPLSLICVFLSLILSACFFLYLFFLHRSDSGRSRLGPASRDEHRLFVQLAFTEPQSFFFVE
jgi:hypothetical protein